MDSTKWYKDSFIYQIYINSFYDSNGDGVGDIKGIISKIDYLCKLGVSAICISPCYKHLEKGNNYAIIDYKDIMPKFGTLSDWKEMVAELHKRGIKLIMDFIMGHTSYSHFWFQEALKDKESPYRDYYIWQKNVKEKEKSNKKDKKAKKRKLPSGCCTHLRGSAWSYDADSGEYYLHLLGKECPSLNWNNPKVRQEICSIAQYWLDIGCDGFRLKNLNDIEKTITLLGEDNNNCTKSKNQCDYENSIHIYLRELQERVFSKYNCFVIGENEGITAQNITDYTKEEGKELDTVFSYEHLNIKNINSKWLRKFKLPKLKRIFADYQYSLRDRGWHSLFFEHYNQKRSLSRFVGKYGNYRQRASKMLAMALYMQQGTPYCFQGQEIGMTSLVSEKDSRAPMQWSALENAGFTSKTVRLPLNPNYKKINVEDTIKDNNSIFYFYQKLFRFRLGNKIIINGTYKENFPSSKNIYCYERWFEGERLIIICNFKSKEQQFRLPSDCVYHTARLILHNYSYDRSLTDMALRPYEALVFLMT